MPSTAHPGALGEAVEERAIGIKEVDSPTVAAAEAAAKKGVTAVEATDDDVDQVPRDLLEGANLVSTAYFFSAWGDRMWEFASVLLVLDIFGDTLLPSSLFGFVEALVSIVAGSFVGTYIDTNDRLVVMRTSVLYQNIAVCASALVFFFALYDKNYWTIEWKWVLFSFTLPFAILAKIMSTMNKICIHKDWLVVLSGGIKQEQTRLNTFMRRIDLICSIVSPLLIGLISSYSSSATSALFLLGWSVASGVLEYNLNAWVFHNVPALQNKLEKRQEELQTALQTAEKGEEVARPSSMEGEDGAAVNGKGDDSDSSCCTSLQVAVAAYMQHRVFFASLAYSMLYISVLSFGGIMISFLKLIGIDDVWLAVGRGIGAGVGVSATYAAPIIISGMGLVNAGLLSIWLQVLCVMPTFFALLFLDFYSQTFAVLIFASLASSRFGLWAFDIMETQIMQDHVANNERGLINGVQDSFMNMGYLLGFVITMVFSSASQFAYPGCISFASIFLAAIIYSYYVYTLPSDKATCQVHEGKKAAEKNKQKRGSVDTTDDAGGGVGVMEIGESITY